ncbi:MAG: hypothetical protein HKN20_14665 [Gemmatimonadetes bacterium]|nr:hypothetical protein [Gemmatimonadota bacterium]
MKIGGTPPPGDFGRVPGDDKPDKAKGADSKFDKKLEGADKNAGSAGSDAADKAGKSGAAQETQAARLKEVVGDVDTSDPKQVEAATDKMVDWVLTERFGPAVLKAKGAGALRSAVREQLLGDPNGAARIRNMLDRMK